MKYTVKRSRTQIDSEDDRRDASFVTLPVYPRPSASEFDLAGPLGLHDPVFDGLLPAWFAAEAAESRLQADGLGFTDRVTRSLQKIYVYQRAHAEGRLDRFLRRGYLKHPSADVFRRFAAMCEGLAIDFEERTALLLQHPLDLESMTPGALAIRRRMIDATNKRAANARKRREQILRDIKQTEGKGWQPTPPGHQRSRLQHD